MPEIRDLTLRRSSPEIALFHSLVQLEKQRRREESGHWPATLLEFEKIYFGFEVGSVRRAINETVNKCFVNPAQKTLLDYGCGGSWWKDTYWPLFKKVLAVEIGEDVLLEIAANYPGNNVELGLTRNGLIDIDEQFDYVLSSSVVGYIHPTQAEYHIKSCYKQLKTDGKLILSRVKAFNLKNWLEGTRLKTSSTFSFSYSYRKHELISLLEKNGFRNIEYFEHGVWLPFGSRLNQLIYRCYPWLMQTALPVFMPFLRFQHMFTAEK